MVSDPWVAALTGQHLGGYRLDTYRGGGAFGIVFEATNLHTGAKHAVKVLAPSTNAEAPAEFDIEGQLLRKANTCSGVINLVDSGQDVVSLNLNGTAVQLPFKYHVLALASGVLEELLIDPVSRVSMPWEERLSLWRGAIKGVHQLHLKEIAHRDLKSSNCLLMVSGRKVEVRIADFGRSKDLSLPPSLSPLEYLGGRGDLRFAPPESIWFQGGHRPSDFKQADIYGLGSLLAELATGHPMTSMAIGSLSAARDLGLRDFRQGVRRDLDVLRPQFGQAIQQIADELPSVIRQDGATLLALLCDPVPGNRMPLSRTGKRVPNDDGLNWLIRRADILLRRLALENRQHSRRANRSRNWSAS